MNYLPLLPIELFTIVTIYHCYPLNYLPLLRIELVTIVTHWTIYHELFTTVTHMNYLPLLPIVYG